jgi:hypothetical protein
MAQRSGGAAGASEPREADGHCPRFSIVVPLFDCRDAGTRALESALGQDFRRKRHEVIAVVDTRARHAWPTALLERCDHVVAIEADFGRVESEIALFDAGSRLAGGEYLYFIEGHTVLEADALRTLDAALVRDEGSALACGRRRNHARTRLGLLIGGNNDAHEARARHAGNFTLGAHCVIRRSLFAALGGFDARFLRFNETVLYQRAADAGVRCVFVEAILCTHHNDAGFRWLLQLLVATGRAKARYYSGAPAEGPRVRHAVYRWLRSPAAASLAALPLRVGAPIAILAAMALVNRFPRAAETIYRIGIGCADVSGFCLERGFAGMSARKRGAVPREFPAPARVATAQNALPVDSSSRPSPDNRLERTT